MVLFDNKYPLCEGLWEALNVKCIGVTHCKLSLHFINWKYVCNSSTAAHTVHKTTLWDMGYQEVLHHVSCTKTAIYYSSHLKLNYSFTVESNIPEDVPSATKRELLFGRFTKQFKLKCKPLWLNSWNEEPENFSHLFLTSFVIYRLELYIFFFILVLYHDLVCRESCQSPAFVNVGSQVTHLGVTNWNNFSDSTTWIKNIRATVLSNGLFPFYVT